jgi:hypothetical protein
MVPPLPSKERGTRPLLTHYRQSAYTLEALSGINIPLGVYAKEGLPVDVGRGVAWPTPQAAGLGYLVRAAIPDMAVALVVSGASVPPP